MTATSVAQPPGRWLPDLITRLGVPETSSDVRERWTWHGGDVGVSIEKLTQAWLAVAWTPHRSITMRCTARPTDPEFGRLVMLTGLYDVRASA